MEQSVNTIATDVLVVGSGFAGCFAAIQAREMGAEVLMVEQGKSGFSGASAVGTHIQRAVLPGDDHDLALKSTVVDSEYMVDQEYAEGAIAESYDIFQKLLELGSDFGREADGEIYWQTINSMNTFFQQKIAIWMPNNSYLHLMNVKKGAVHLGVEVLDRIVVTDLLTSKGKVVGAVGINKRKGDFYVFKAKAVVLATGTSTLISGDASVSNASWTGDGIAMALRAGADLRGMEFGHVEPGVGSKVFDDMDEATKTIGYSLLPYQWDMSNDPTVRVVNALGEEFLEQYEFTYKRPDRFYPGSPFTKSIPAIIKECREGRGPCYYTSGGPTGGEIGIGGHMISQPGGIRINPFGVSTLSGLFAGGITSDMCCAPPFSIPANLLGSQITGRRAGESAALYAKEQSEPVVDEGEIKRLKKEVYGPLGRDKGITEEELRIKTIEAYLYLDLRNEKNLARAIEEFRQLEEDAVSLVADDYHELAKCLKFRNFIQVSQTVAMAARERRETRIDHFREDYPLVNNIDWLKWVIVRGTGEQMETILEDIPLEKWKYRPEPEMIDRLQPRKEE